MLILIISTANAAEWPMVRGDTTNNGHTSESLTLPLTLAWKADVDGIVLSSPVISDGLVYAGSTSTYVYALEENTGKEKWKYKTGGWIRWSPAVVNGVVYVSSEDGYVYALDKNTGELKWKIQPRSSTSQPVSSPIVAGNLVYVLSKGPSVVDSGICALDAITGNLKWYGEAAPEALIDGASPAISNGILYIGIDNSLYALDAKQGELKWKYATEKPVGMPSISNGVVYVSANDYFYAIDASTGRERWKGKLGPVRSSPSIANNKIYVTEFNRVNAMYSMTGVSSWRSSCPGILFSPPTISNDIVYIGSGSYLQALDAQTGLLKWNYAVESTLSSSPAIANRRIYIGSDGYVYAFEKSYESPTALVSSINNKIPLFEGYSLIFSKLSFEDVDDITELAELELQKDGVKVESESYKEGSIMELGNKGLPIIRGNVDTIFLGMTTNLVKLNDVTVFSESGDIIVSDINGILLRPIYGKEKVGKTYWKLNNGYWLRLEIYPNANQVIFYLEKYASIDKKAVSVGQEFSLKNSTGITILSGTLENITRQDKHIAAKLSNIVQYPTSRIASKVLTNLTDDELKNIISEKSNEYKPSQILIWNLSNGYSLRLMEISEKYIWFVLEKNGLELANEVVAEGDEFSLRKRITTGSSLKDVILLSGTVDRISLDPWYVVISNVNLYSENGNILMYDVSFDVPSAISSAQKSIDYAKSIYADTSEAEYLLQQARDKMWNGEYAESMSFAIQAKESAEGIKATRMKQYGIGIIFFICITMIAYFKASAKKRKIGIKHKEARLKEYKETQNKIIQMNDILLNELIIINDENAIMEVKKMKSATVKNNISEAKLHHNRVIDHINKNY